MRIREATMKDYPEVESLWKAAGLYRHWMQNRLAISRKFSREPDLFLVAEERGIVAAAIGGFDGQFGSICHLAVHPDHRNKGIARALVEEIESRLRKKGALTCYVLAEVPEVFKGMEFSEAGDTFLTKRL